MRKHGLIDIQILEVLGRYGSDSKRLGQQQIISYLERDYNVIIGRAALSGYLAALREAGFVKGQKGYYRVNIFSDTELKILMDGVFYGKEIPDGEAIELIEKLRGFSYLKLKNYMTRVDYIEDLNHTGNQNVNVIREIIGEAIRKNRKILVTSCIYDINGNLIPHKVFTADPYRIVSDKCRYYLICHVDRAGEKDGIENRRLDRFWNVKILKDDICRRIETIPGFQNGFQLGEYMKEHVYMFSGESEQINIRIDRIRIGEFIDWYGKDYTILEGDENSENIIIRFKANVNAVYYWAQQYGKYVTVLKPDSLRRRLLTYFTDMYMIYSETDKSLL